MTITDFKLLIEKKALHNVDAFAKLIYNFYQDDELQDNFGATPCSEFLLDLIDTYVELLDIYECFDDTIKKFIESRIKSANKNKICIINAFNIKSFENVKFGSDGAIFVKSCKIPIDEAMCICIEYNLDNTESIIQQSLYERLTRLFLCKHGWEIYESYFYEGLYWNFNHAPTGTTITTVRELLKLT